MAHSHQGMLRALILKFQSGKLPYNYCSAQQAENFAQTRMCCFAQGQTVIIYSDSRNAYGVMYDFGTLWHERGFLTSSGTLIKNGYLIANLLKAILLPSTLAVIKCEAHMGGSDDVSEGCGHFLDEAA